MIAVEKRDARHVAKRIHETTSQIFRFAIARDIAVRNLTADFKPRDILPGAQTENRARVDAKELPDLLVKIDNYNGDAITRLAMKLMTYTIDHVWAAIALHTTPGIPQYMRSVVALVTAGVELDVLGVGLSDLDASTRDLVLAKFPRTPHFKEDIIQAFYDGIKHKPDTTFGNIKADVLADKDPHFERVNFCSIIRASGW